MVSLCADGVDSPPHDDAAAAWRPTWDTCVALFRDGGKLLRSCGDNVMFARLTAIMGECDRWVSRAQKLLQSTAAQDDGAASGDAVPSAVAVLSDGGGGGDEEAESEAVADGHRDTPRRCVANVSEEAAKLLADVARLPAVVKDKTTFWANDPAELVVALRGLL